MATKECAACKGKGLCGSCGGRGEHVGFITDTTCGVCDGNKTCPVCDGSGEVDTDDN
jgi:hypothetical protein